MRNRPVVACRQLTIAFHWREESDKHSRQKEQKRGMDQESSGCGWEWWVSPLLGHRVCADGYQGKRLNEKLGWLYSERGESSRLLSIIRSCSQHCSMTVSLRENHVSAWWHRYLVLFWLFHGRKRLTLKEKAKQNKKFYPWTEVFSDNFLPK